MNWVLMRVIDAVRGTIGDVWNASRSSEQKLLWRTASARNVSSLSPSRRLLPSSTLSWHTSLSSAAPTQLPTILAKMCGTSCFFWRIPAIFAPSPLPHRAMLNGCSQSGFDNTTLNGGERERCELLTETHFLHKQTEDRVCRVFFKLVPHNFGQDCSSLKSWHYTL